MGMNVLPARTPIPVEGNMKTGNDQHRLLLKGLAESPPDTATDPYRNVLKSPHASSGDK